MNFKHYKPKFEFESKINDLSWPWAGHKNFAYDLIANFKPRKVVELGTHYGTSLWSFSQAAKDHGIDVELFAIDTWRGEKHAGLYDEDVFDTVKHVKKTFYDDLRISLIRKKFHEALADFMPGSIDVLHIDGLHTYEAVKDDFTSWLPKMKKNGIVLFHDIKVMEGDFGVFRLWEEIKDKYVTVEFFHSFGLGVVFLDKNLGDQMKVLEKELQMHYSYIHEIKRSQLIQSFIAEVADFKAVMGPKYKWVNIIVKGVRLLKRVIRKIIK